MTGHVQLPRPIAVLGNEPGIKMRIPEIGKLGGPMPGPVIEKVAACDQGRDTGRQRECIQT
ncbi:hypothetical protein WDZ92_51235, partial [Nostoc sp. NIES-2111]